MKSTTVQSSHVAANRNSDPDAVAAALPPNSSSTVAAAAHSTLQPVTASPRRTVQYCF